MNKIRKLLLSCGLLLLPSLAYAVPVTDFVDTLFIGGGVMLFYRWRITAVSTRFI